MEKIIGAYMHKDSRFPTSFSLIKEGGTWGRWNEESFPGTRYLCSKEEYDNARKDMSLTSETSCGCKMYYVKQYVEKFESAYKNAYES